MYARMPWLHGNIDLSPIKRTRTITLLHCVWYRRKECFEVVRFVPQGKDEEVRCGSFAAFSISVVQNIRAVHDCSENSIFLGMYDACEVLSSICIFIQPNADRMIP